MYYKSLWIMASAKCQKSKQSAIQSPKLSYSLNICIPFIVTLKVTCNKLVPLIS